VLLRLVLQLGNGCEELPRPADEEERQEQVTADVERVTAALAALVSASRF